MGKVLSIFDSGQVTDKDARIKACGVDCVIYNMKGFAWLWHLWTDQWVFTKALAMPNMTSQLALCDQSSFYETWSMTWVYHFAYLSRYAWITSIICTFDLCEQSQTPRALIIFMGLQYQIFAWYQHYICVSSDMYINVYFIAFYRFKFPQIFIVYNTLIVILICNKLLELLQSIMQL